MICEDVFIANLKFNECHWQIWFRTNKEMNNPQETFKESMKAVEQIGDSCLTANEFFEEATRKIEEFGFKKETHNSPQRNIKESIK